MKIQIKLDKVEAQAFKNFAEVVRPDEISDADFVKSIFKLGLEEMENRLMKAVEKHAEENNIDMDALRTATDEETIQEILGDADSDTSDENKTIEEEKHA